MYHQYRDRAAFYVVYILEAHASDVWQMASNVKENVIIATPKNYRERSAVAGSCVRKLGIEIPAVIDDFRNSAEEAYKAWPDRLYLIDREGRVAYKSQPGPFGFKPRDLEAELKRLVVGRF